MAADVRTVKYARVGGDGALLAMVGFRWAKAHCTSQRDTPSRREAFELAQRALGRRPNQQECIAVQRAARDACRSRITGTEALPPAPAA